MQTDSPTPGLPKTPDGRATRPRVDTRDARDDWLRTRLAGTPNDAPAEFAHDQAEARRRARRVEERATARPVRLVDLDLPFSAVFALYVQFAIIQVLVAAAVVLLLFVVGVL